MALVVRCGGMKMFDDNRMTIVYTLLHLFQ